MKYIGNSPDQYTQTEDFICTASEGQTVFTESDAGKQIRYSVGYIDVYVNGIRLSETSDFTATDGSSVTILVTIESGDSIAIHSKSTSSYTSYFVDSPENGDRSNKIATTEYVAKYATRPKIDKITRNGYNGMSFISEGLLYTVNGNQAWSVRTDGVTPSADLQDYFGFPNASQVPIYEDSPVVDCGGHFYSNCWALLENGNLYTWGSNNYGSCGLGSTSYIYNPTLAATNVAYVYEHPNAGSYDISYQYMVIGKTDGTIWSAGYNGYGQLGPINNGSYSTANQTTFQKWTLNGQDVVNPRFVSPIGNRYGSTVLQTEDGNVYIYGYNGYGQHGNGGTGNATQSLNVNSWIDQNSNLTIKKIFGSQGYYNTTPSSIGMWIEDSSTGFSKIKTSGYNGNGFIGNGGTTNISTPYTISVNYNGTTTNNLGILDVEGCGSLPAVKLLLDNNVLYSWGRNSVGQVGIGNTTNPITTPTRISVDPTDTDLNNGLVSRFMNPDYSIYAYGYNAIHIIERKDNNRLMACGHNPSSQCGTNSNSSTITSYNYVNLPKHETVKFIGHYSTTTDGDAFFAVCESNTVYAWGYNGHYAIMDTPVTTEVFSPRVVSFRRTK